MAEKIEIKSPSKPMDDVADILYPEYAGKGADTPEPHDKPAEPAPRASEPTDEPAGPTFTADEVATHTALLTGRQRLEAADAAFVQKYGSGDVSVLARQIAELEKTDRARAHVLRTEVREYLGSRQKFVQQLGAADQHLKQRVTARQYDSVHKTERAKLLAAAPDLADRKTADQFHRWLRSEGYSAEQIATTTSHRPLLHLHKLWRAQGSAPAAPKGAPVRIKMPRRASSANTVDLRSPGTRVADELYPDLARQREARRRSTSTPRRDPRLEDAVSILYPESRR